MIYEINNADDTNLLSSSAFPEKCHGPVLHAALISAGISAMTSISGNEDIIYNCKHPAYQLPLCHGALQSLTLKKKVTLVFHGKGTAAKGFRQ